MDTITIIQSLGFPIAMVVFCIFFIKYIYDQQTKAYDAMIQRESERWAQIAKLVEAVDHNTAVLNALVDRLVDEQIAQKILSGDSDGKTKT